MFYVDGSQFVQKKKSKKMRPRMNYELPTVMENEQQLQNSVESNTVVLQRLHEHNTVNVTDKHVESTAKLTNDQKHTNKKRNKTRSVVPDGVSSSECDVVSKTEERHQKSREENVATADTDQHAHRYIDQQSEPSSGIKDVLGYFCQKTKSKRAVKWLCVCLCMCVCVCICMWVCV